MPNKITDNIMIEKKHPILQEVHEKSTLNPNEIIELGEDAAALVGGKNLNCAILASIPEVRDAEFRTVSSIVYDKHLDRKYVNRETLDLFINKAVEKFEEVTKTAKVTKETLMGCKSVRITDKTSENIITQLRQAKYLEADGMLTALYKQDQNTLQKVNWGKTGLPINKTSAVIRLLQQTLEQPKFVYEKGLEYRRSNKEAKEMASDVVTIRQYITSQITKSKDVLNKELRKKEPAQQKIYRCKAKLSIAAQIAILAVEMDDATQDDIAKAYDDLNNELISSGKLKKGDNCIVAIRSSAVGEDSEDAAFAGAQDTFLNIFGREEVINHTQRDFASGFNIRALEYRLSQIDKEIKEKGTTREKAFEKFDFDNIAVSVVIQRMINSGKGKAGTAFSLDPTSGLRNLVYIDSNFGYGETVVGGLTNPDNDIISFDGKLHVYSVGNKDVMMVNDTQAGIGTMLVDTPPNKRYVKVLTKEEVLDISKQVQAIKKHYNNMEVDTEFAIDEDGDRYIIQARPETNYNELDKIAPGIILMRRMEVEPNAAKISNVLINGAGASVGAATGSCRYITKEMVTSGGAFNIFKKGDILIADRTDPDFLPLFNLAGAVVSNVGGRTSHAAITSRELNIPAVIGVGDIELLKSLDGQTVTVDGSGGNLYAGALKLIEIGEDIDTNRIIEAYPTKTSIGLILADVNQAKRLSQLKNIPDFKVGLLRAEFVLGAIGIHYEALKAYDEGLFDEIISMIKQDKLKETLNTIKHKIQKQDHPITTTPMLTDKEKLINSMINIGMPRFKSNDDFIKHLEITKQDIALRLKIYGFKTGHDFYVNTLCQQIALFAKAFEGKDVIYRTTDYKSNEYQGLIGGFLFEEDEDNPMLGWRGVSRLIDPWEIEAFIKARKEQGATNLHIMFPFVRTEKEMMETIALTRAHGLRRGDDGLKMFVMAEIPSIASIPHSFLKHVDGFSIGSNDLTQGILMTDRDSQKLQGTYDEEDPAVIKSILGLIFAGIKKGKEVGFCGMGVSNSEFIASTVAIAGITSASATADVYAKVKENIFNSEKKGIQVWQLGDWMNVYKLQEMQKALLELRNTGFFSTFPKIQTDFTPEQAMAWVHNALQHAHERRVAYYRIGNDQEVGRADKSILYIKKHLKAIIQANIDWNQIVREALYTAGFKGDAEYYSQYLRYIRTFDKRMERMFNLIPPSHPFNHSTIFSGKIKYLLQRLNTLPNEIELQQSIVDSAEAEQDTQHLVEARNDMNQLLAISSELQLLSDDLIAFAEELNI